MAQESLVAKLLTLPAFQEIDQNEPALTEEQKKQKELRLAALLRDFILKVLDVQEQEE